MRLSTIWTLPSMSTMDKLRHTRKWAVKETATRLPKEIRRWVVIQELAKISNDPSHVICTTIDELIPKLER